MIGILVRSFLIIFFGSVAGFSYAEQSANVAPSGQSLPLAVQQDCPDCPVLISIKPPAESGIQPFYIGKFEVTWHEYLQSVRENKCPIPRGLGGVSLNLENIDQVDDRVAVSGVSISDVSCYFRWLEGRSGRKYRLPSAREWEFAARGGARTRFPWGDQVGYNNAILLRTYDITIEPDLFMKGPRSPSIVREVGLMAPNAYGLYDVIGNVSELTSDYRIIYAPQPCLHGKTSCIQYEVRGGSAMTDERSDLNSVTYLNEDIQDSATGFRVVRIDSNAQASTK